MELDDTTTITHSPFVEVELVYETANHAAAVTGRGWCALEVHTKNRIYEVDWSMRCFGVTDLETGEPAPHHRLIGALLTGGQRRGSGAALELTYPIPRPGVSAVFEVGTEPRLDYVTTTEVTRVVLRLRVFMVPDAEDAAPRWQALSGSFRATRPGHDEPDPR